MDDHPPCPCKPQCEQAGIHLALEKDGYLDRKNDNSDGNGDAATLALCQTRNQERCCSRHDEAVAAYVLYALIVGPAGIEESYRFALEQGEQHNDHQLSE